MYQRPIWEKQKGCMHIGLVRLAIKPASFQNHQAYAQNMYKKKAAGRYH